MDAHVTGAREDEQRGVVAFLPARVSLRRRALMFAVGVLAVVPFLPALTGEFLHWDDRMLLTENPLWQGPEGWAWILFSSAGGDFGPYMPLTWLSYRFDLAVGGLNPIAFRATNLLLHAVATAALFAVARRLFAVVSEELRSRRRLRLGASFAVAAIWAIHPLRVESVTWIAERRDVLSGALLLLSLRAWLDHVATRREPGEFWRSRAWWAAFVLYAASMLAKSTALGWPLILLLLDVWPLRRRGVRALLAETAPFAVVAASVAAAAWWGQVDSGAFADVPFVGRLVLAAHAAGFLLLRTALPLGLRAHYLRPAPFDPLDPVFIVPAAVAVVVTVVVFVRAHRSPAPAAAWCAALILLAPVSGAIPIGSHAIADRYTYLPAIPLLMLVCGGVAAWLGARTRVGAALVVVAVFALAPVTGRLASVWRDTRGLFLRVVELEPRNWLAHTMLGSLCELEGDHAQAVMWYRESEALRSTGDSLARLGWAQLRAGDPEAARVTIERALAVEPGHVMALVHLGILAAQGGDLGGAERAFRDALAIDPEHAKAHFNLAVVLLRTGRGDDAEHHLRASLAADPGYVAALVALAERLEERGALDEARRLAARALGLSPAHAGAVRLAARLGVTR